MPYPLRLIVNGKEHNLLVESHETLAAILRDHFHLTGTKVSCGEGDCGACTVLVDGKAVNSCIVLALSVQEASVQTIEGLSQGEKLHPIQEAFLEAGAIQCGFCTPGMVMAAKGLLDQNPFPSEREIREGLSGNICRCTGYEKIIQAVQIACQKKGLHEE
jgi:carbon-monoxide dehydrogenase small subunit